LPGSDPANHDLDQSEGQYSPNGLSCGLTIRSGEDYNQSMKPSKLPFLKLLATKDSVADNLPKNCGNCRCSIGIDDPKLVVCVAHLDFRVAATGGDCSSYARKLPFVPLASSYLPRH
jgi:hypothetical protein